MKVAEVELLPYFGQSVRYKHPSVKSDRNPIDKKIQSGTIDAVGKSRGYTIYLDKNPEYFEYNSRFYAVNDQTGLVDMTVDGTLSKKGGAYTFIIHTLEGRVSSKLKAYEFYRIIMTKMPVIMVTDTQSYGGMRTWQELSRYPDIEVFGWSKGKPINIDPRDSDETHATEHEPEAKDIMKMKLVAHKKIK